MAQSKPIFHMDLDAIAEVVAEKIAERLLPKLSGKTAAPQTEATAKTETAAQKKKRVAAEKKAAAADKKASNGDASDDKSFGAQARAILRDVFDKRGEEAARTILDALDVQAVHQLDEDGMGQLIDQCRIALAEKPPEKPDADGDMFA